MNWRGWIRGIVGSMISGGAGAIGSGTGVTLADPEHFALYNGGLHKLGEVVLITFIFSAVISLGKYLQAHPLPGDSQ